MADGGLIDKANARVKQAVSGIADFINIGRPATTEVVSGGRAYQDNSRPIVQADTRPDMPQERNPRRFADEVDQRKEARRGGYEVGGLLRDDSATRINQASQPGMAAQVSSFLAGVPDAARAPTPQFGPSLAQSAGPAGQTLQSQGLLTGIQDYGTTPAQLANSGQPAFVNPDGTPRNMVAPSPVAQPSPVLTMKERDIAAGVDPNRAYRPGTAADPRASGPRGAAAPAAAGTAAAGTAAALDRKPMAAPNLRNWRQRRAGEYADGGIVIPVNIGQGLYQAIAQPIIEDWRQGNVAIKNVRNKYPTADAIAGIHPAVAAAQVANDVMAGNVGGDTAMNVAQAVPMVKGLTGMAKMLSKQGGPTIGGTKFVIDMPGTVRKNMALTAGQTLGQPANAFADGGMVKFAGKGGPRDDQIPVAVAGNEINVSDGEAAVILPAKTAANAAALGIIGGLIEATNDGRKPKMGMRDGGKYARGALPVRQYPDEIDVARGLMETENARAADAAARAKAARAGAVVPVAAPETYRPDWTQPRNVPAQFSPPALEGVVETVADQRAASMAAQPRALNAPTNVVPPISQPNWTAGGNPPNVGPIGGGQWANQGWNSPPGRATMPQGGGIQSVLQALPAPTPELMKASSDARTAAGAKAAGRASKEAAAYASRPAFETSPWANARPNAAIAGKVLGRVIPAVGGAISAANIADVATDPNKTKADVATQAAREAGGLGAAVAGGALGAKAGAALGVLGGPLVPITVPAGALAGGIVGGLASNYGANALMDLGGDGPAKNSNGVVKQFFGGSAQQPTVDPVRARHNAILNSGAAAGSINLPITQAAKQTAFANTDAARRVAANEDSGAAMHNGIVTSEMGRGFDPTKLTMATGYGMASNAAGKTMGVGPSQYVAADGSTTSRWEDTQQYKDAIARNEADKLWLAEMQAARRGADPMVIQAARQGIAGAVLGNQAKQAEMQRNEYIQSLVAKAAAETDPVKQRAAVEMALAAQGKSGRQVKNLHVVDLGEDTVTDQMGAVKTVKRGQAIYDADTGRVVPIGQVGGAAPKSFASQAEAEAAQKAGRIKVGDVVVIGGKRFAVE